MKVLTWLDDASAIVGDSVVALGNFDGLHKGHQELIKETVKIAGQKGLSALVFTFRNHPANEIAGKTVVKNIMDIHEKSIVAERLGVEYMVNIRFDKMIMKMEPEEFVKRVLVKNLHIRHAVCGFNYNFGYKGMGNPALLAEYGKKYGFDVTVVPEYAIDGQTVSSTYIRELISDGNMKRYEQFTGRTYKIGGYVMHGQHFGRTMGFPTANLNLSQDMVLPVNGVYVTNIIIDGKKYHSVTNVGNKPTVGEFDKNAETHIFDYNGDIYGKRVIVEFIDILRPEKKFDSQEELAAQIDRDCIHAREYHQNIGNRTED